jgi:hypothetical protein
MKNETSINSIQKIFWQSSSFCKSRNSEWVRGLKTRCSNPGTGKGFCLFQKVQRVSGAHLASYSINTSFRPAARVARE